MKRNEGKIDAVGISSQYNSLPFGEKNKFARAIADILQMSTDNVRRRIAKSEFKEIEIQALNVAGVI